MFTGLVEEVGQVAEVRTNLQGARLVLEAAGVAPTVAIGDSVCINGVCLTVVARSESHLEFDAVPETLRRSNLGRLREGDSVNLERSLAADGRLGGHVVQGHVDGVGQVTRIVPQEPGAWLTISAPPEVHRYIVEKGSIAVDGISLTVAELGADGTFSVALIPHTLSATNLAHRRVGDPVNLEADVLAKYVERLLKPHLPLPPDLARLARS
jgi:riboflavin synthase